MLNQRAMNQYKYANATAVVGASPYRVITLLMQGALDRLSQAKGCIRNNNISGRNESLKKASDIIDCLKGSLDHKHDEAMTQNLNSLYDYMIVQLFQANLKNDASLVDEVSDLLATILDGWSQLGENSASLAESNAPEQNRHNAIMHQANDVSPSAQGYASQLVK